MFERFTKSARAAVIEAQFVARSTNSRAIDARHLLVAVAEDGPSPAHTALAEAGVNPTALAQALRTQISGTGPAKRDGAGLDALALAAIGIDLEEVRRATDATFGKGAFDGVTGRGRRGRTHTPFAPEGKKALELALREAIRLGSASIDSGHLLLGILRGGSAATTALRSALAEAGSDDATLRAAVEREQKAA